VAVVARGSLAERSAPRLVAALAARAFTGVLTIEAGGRAFRIAWQDGAVVGAQSPNPADSAAKVAVTLGVLSTTQAGEVARIIAATPGVDELEVVAQTARLTTELVGRLARRLAGARAARALSVEVGTFVVDDEAAYWGNVAPVDARWVLYSGLRSHFTVERAERELATLASAVRLRAGGDLDGFGFGAAEDAVIARLRAGELSVAPVPADLDRQVAQAVALALLLSGEAEVARAPVPPAAAAPAPVPAPVTAAAPAPVAAAAAAPASARAKTSSNPAVSEPRTKSGSAPPVSEPRTKTGSTPPVSVSRTRTGPAAVIAAREKIRGLIAERLAVLDGGGTHFALLGVADDASTDEIRARYFALARHLHPDRLRAAGIDDDRKDAQRLFARINEAFTVLTDPEKRARYQSVQRAGGEAAVKARDAAAEAAVRKALDAEERFRLGEMALRRQQLELAIREFEKAVELNPDEADHHAMLGWAVYVGASNKAAAVPIARGHLLRALEKNRQSVAAHLALGRVTRMEGLDGEAQRHFQQALELAPNHPEATAELRAIEVRLKAGGDRKAGLFGRLTKKP